MEININEKTFRRIPTFPNYYVSKDGEIFSYYSNRLLTVNYNTGAVNYPTVCLSRDGIPSTHTVHQLVAITWCKLPDNKTAEEMFIANKKREYLVDHIDGDKKNFHADNLRWCTPVENFNFDNWDRSRRCQKLIGNKNAVGKRKYSGPSHRYVYIYNNKEYTARELAEELKCSKSKITESFRKNCGLVRLGILTRREK